MQKLIFICPSDTPTATLPLLWDSGDEQGFVEKVGDALRGGDHSVQLGLSMAFYFLFFMCIFFVLAVELPGGSLVLLGKQTW